MADTYVLKTTVNHIVASLDDFAGTGNIEDTIRSYVNTKPAGSYARFIYDQNPIGDHEYKVVTLMHIVGASIGDLSSFINQIDTNLTGLPGTYRRRHLPEIQDVDFGEW